jgi:hypothetical protein
MITRILKQWMGVALLLLALLHADSLRSGPVGELPGSIEERSAVNPGNTPEEELFPAWLVSITEKIAYEHGLSPRLVKSIILAESNGNPRKISPKGAKGLMQLMPVVTRYYQVKNPLEPIANIQAGAKYLVNLLEQFSGDLPLALAAYNAGPTAVRKYGGIPPFPETQAFVIRVSDIFHSLEPWPRILHLAANLKEQVDAAAHSRFTSFRAGPRKLHLWMKKMPPEVFVAQLQ